MRTYIFTPRERRVIREILKGEKTEDLYRIKYRVKTFKDLESDVELYLRLRERLAQA